MGTILSEEAPMKFLAFIGILAILVGLVLAVLGTIGHAVGGRRHYY